MKSWINNKGLSLKSVITASAISTSAVILSSLMVINPTYASDLVTLWQLDNFDQPESVVANPIEKAIYVSNINGQPTELNGKGYISKLSADGEMLNKFWITNLDAPKGIAISGDNLYIADMQRVHQVSISKGVIINQFQVDQAKMLNDIAIADDGTVYISDLLAGGIYRITDNQISLWFEHKDLPHPNGLLWQHDELLVASWGLGLKDDFTTQTAGSLYTLNIENPELVVIKGSEQLGNLDGLAQKDDALYVSDWISGELFKIEDNKSSTVLTLKPGLADIGIAGSVLFTPSMFDGQVTAWKL
jgi:sugar lactone lactonase YvrE